MLNVGYIEGSSDGVAARIYYDATSAPTGDDQPLIDGPRGYCLDLTNTSGKRARVEVALPNGNTRTVDIGKGDPVVGGPTAERSRPLAQVQALGFTTRGDVSGFMVG